MTTTNEIHSKLDALSPKLRDLEKRCHEKADSVKSLELSQIDGTSDSLMSEREELHGLNLACEAARNEEGELLAAYEAAILSESAQIVLEHLKASAKDAGALFDKYIEFRNAHAIYGKSRDEIARSFIADLSLNYASARLREYFHKSFGVNELHGISSSKTRNRNI